MGHVACMEKEVECKDFVSKPEGNRRTGQSTEERKTTRDSENLFTVI